MNLKKWTEDSFLSGLIAGVLLLLIFYTTVSQIRHFFADYYNDPYLFASPRPQLIAVALNMICFRFLMLRFNREKTGKGILFITVLATFAYIIFYYKMRN